MTPSKPHLPALPPALSSWSVDDMCLFAHILTCGSLSGAARNLGLPRSTVSDRLAALEGAAGLRLLERTTRSLRPTPAGLHFFAYCQEVLRLSDEARAQMSLWKQAPQGALRLTVGEASGLVLFPRILARFRSKYPEVEVSIRVTDSVLDLARDGVDLAFRAGRFQDASHTSVRLGHLRYVLVAPAHTRPLPELSHLEAIAQHTVWVHESIPEWKFRLASGEERVAPLPPRAFRASSLLFLKEALLEGGGLALLPRFLCAKEIQSGQLVECGKNLPEPVGLEYYAVYAKRDTLSAAQKAFLEHVKSEGFAQLIAGQVA